MHYEFYVLWPDHTWSVEGIDLERRYDALEEDIAYARKSLQNQIAERRLVSSPIIGPLFYVTELTNQPRRKAPE